MAQDVSNPLSATSYTNKDFEAIYTELLDLVKKLTNKWDPSSSNESDPGVLLLKLYSIIGDKCNFNSDVNLLETFPISVSQEPNARQLFEELGYYMHWYKSATTNISMKYTGKTSDSTAESFTIPRFTQVCNDTTSVIYTLIGPSEGTDKDSFIVGTQALPIDGTIISFKAIEGIPIQYDIDGVTTVSYNDLDENRRLYFTNSNVAENGVFISNVNNNNYNEWIRKDNLVIEKISEENRFYKFGLSQDTNSCYIEFPENAEELIDEGIEIYYIQSSGVEGNITSKTVSKFYTNITPVEDDSIILSSDNVTLYNPSAATNGENYESINDAYKGYKATVGTFETLVTLRDYINYIYKKELVSNGFACDRTNDVQCTYHLIENDNGVDTEKTVLETHTDSSDDLTAFSLKLYLLQYNDNMTNAVDYLSTFYPTSDMDNIESYIEDVKCITSDYKDLAKSTAENAHICYLLNKYPLTVRVYTQHYVTEEQKADISQNIRYALYENLNARKLNFGEEIDEYNLKDIITNSDERIKSIKMDSLIYTTYAVYTLDGTVYKEIQVSQEFDDEEILENLNTCYVSITRQDGSTLDSVDVDGDVFADKNGIVNYSPVIFVKATNGWVINGSTVVVDLGDWGVTINDNPEIVVGDTIEVGLDKARQFKDDIYAKSILAGKTPLLVKDEQFDYSIQQNSIKRSTHISQLNQLVENGFSSTSTENIYKLSSNVDLINSSPDTLLLTIAKTSSSAENSYTLTYSSSLSSYVDNSTSTKYKLKVNDYSTITLYQESTASEYSQGVKVYSFEITTTDLTPILSNVYKLQPTYETEFRVGISGKSDVTSIALKPNETIQVYTPTLVETTLYSTNVLYELYLASGSTITPGLEYELKSYEDGTSDVLACYYKESSTDSVYKYFIYSSGNIVKFSFTPTVLSTYNNLLCYQLLTDGIEFKDIGTTNHHVYVKSTEDFGMLPISISTNVESNYKGDNDHSLNSTTKTISIMTGNTYTIDNSGNYCYWILNDYVEDVNGKYWYYLFDKTNTTGTITATRTLSAGEYFFYANSEMTDLVIFGSGSRVTINIDTSLESASRFLRCLKISDSSTILEQGISGIADYLIKIPASISIELMECSVTSYSNETIIASATYTDSSSETVASWSLPITYELTDLKQTTTSGKEILIKFNNTDYSNLSSYFGAPQVRSIVNFTTGWSTEHPLYENQKLHITQINPSTLVENSMIINGAGSVGSSDAVYVLSDIDISTNGDEVHIIPDDGTYASIYTYNKNLSHTGSLVRRISYNSSGTTSLIYDGGTVQPDEANSYDGSTEKKIMFTLPIGDYLLPVTIPNFKDINASSTNKAYVTITLDGVNLKEIGTDETQFSTKGVHYIQFSTTSVTKATLDIKITNMKSSTTTSITLGNLYKYVHQSFLGDGYFERLFARVKQLQSTYNFDYTYQIPEADLIENPLSASSFFLDAHVFNDYTIAQMNTQQNKFIVLGNK